MTFFENDIAQGIQDNQLIGPLDLKTSIRVAKEGLDHLMSLPDEIFFLNVKNICQYDDKLDWGMDQPHFLMRKKTKCASSFIKHFKSLIALGSFDNLRSVAPYKDFFNTLQTYNQELNTYLNLFGEEHIKIEGQITANTPSNMPFKAFFHYGGSKSLGAIGDFIHRQ